MTEAALSVSGPRPGRDWGGRLSPLPAVNPVVLRFGLKHPAVGEPGKLKDRDFRMVRASDICKGYSLSEYNTCIIGYTGVFCKSQNQSLGSVPAVSVPARSCRFPGGKRRTGADLTERSCERDPGGVFPVQWPRRADRSTQRSGCQQKIDVSKHVDSWHGGEWRTRTVDLPRVRRTL